METLCYVFLEMDPHQMHFLVMRDDIFLCVLGISEIMQRHAAVRAQRHVVLRNLIIFRHVRVEIIFAIELADGRNIASEHQSHQHGHAQRFLIHHRQRAGQPEANRTRVRVRLRAKFNWRSAKHFGARLELHVHFKTDGRDVVHAQFNIR